MSPKIGEIKPHLSALKAPVELASLEGWLIWRYETHNGESKPRKVPYYTDGGRRHGQQGSATDRSKLTSFAAARDAASHKGFTGVGLAMLADWGITALDFDKCVVDGRLPPEVLAIVGRTYAEWSPSGQGVRAFVKGALGNHKSLAEPGRFGIETFNSNGFVTYTGNMLPHVDLLGLENTIAEADDAVRSLCEARFGRSTPTPNADPEDPWAGLEPQIGLSIEQMQTLLAGLDPDMGRDDWIRVGMALHHECEGDDTGFDLWNDWSENGGKYPSEEALRAQWDSFTRRMGPGRRQITMASVLKMAKEAGIALPRPTLAANAEDLKSFVANAAKAHSEVPGYEGVHTPDGFESKFPIIGAGALTRRPSPQWWIQGLLPDADLVVMFGASGSGKSFVALDMCGAVARGLAWRGRRTRKGRILIIAAEGGGGYGNRIKAYCQHHSIDADKLDIGLIIAAPNFLQKSDITEVIKAISEARGVDLIIVDTFAQVTPGANENSGEDVGLALANTKALREAAQETVLLVHHSGKDATKGARGWSGLKAAADAEIEVVQNGAARCAHVTKMKESEDGLEFHFELEKIDLGTNEDGDEIASCVVKEVDRPLSTKAFDKAPKGAKQMGAIQKAVRLAAGQLGAITKEGASLEELVDRVKRSVPYDPGENKDGKKRDQRRSHVIRAIKSLCEGGCLVVHDERVYDAISAPDFSEDLNRDG
jgi:hypothetical protein